MIFGIIKKKIGIIKFFFPRVQAGNLTGCGLVQECREFLTRGLDAPSTVVAPCRHSRACPLEKKTEAYRWVLF